MLSLFGHYFLSINLLEHAPGFLISYFATKVHISKVFYMSSMVIVCTFQTSPQLHSNNFSCHCYKIFVVGLCQEAKLKKHKTERYNNEAHGKKERQ